MFRRYKVQPERRRAVTFYCPDCGLALDYRTDADASLAHLKSHRYRSPLKGDLAPDWD